MLNSAGSAHRWRFFRAGGLDQVRLDSGADLLSLDQLDQKLWMALACPINGVEFDRKTLELIDTDGDQRIRAPELIAAVKWAGSVLKDPEVLIKGSDRLPLAAVNDATPEGLQLLNCARRLLVSLRKSNSPEISIAEAIEASRIFAETAFNGDGVIIPESADTDASKAVINDIGSCMGTTPDRSGKPGIDQARADAFFEGCAAYDGWMKRAEADPAGILPAGDRTAAASAAVAAVKAKVDDYFGRCNLAAYDARALPILNRSQEEYVPIAMKDLSIAATESAHFPLAQVAPGKPLPLRDGIHPAHATAIAELQSNAIKPLLGDRTELTEADWFALQARLETYHKWLADKAGGAVEKLGIGRVREILGGSARDDIRALIVKDKALEPEAASMANVEKLVRYVRNLRELCANFVNFENFYSGSKPAIFQCGALYLDQRSCHLCLTVDDAGKHAAMAGLAGTYLAYCDCVRRGSGEKMSIVAAFMQGDDDNLMVGRNGVFYDRQGRDYDATITKIVSNPISLRQAFWMPYKKLVRMIEQQVVKRAAAAEAASDAKMAQAATAAAQADKAKPAEPKKIDVGTVAALGVAFGSIGAFLATLAGYATGVVKLGPLAIIAAIIVILLLISGPSMILAYIKLRKRSLGPILDANGWAVNGRASINVPFGTAMTGIAKLPPGSERDLSDRFAEKRSPWLRVILVIIIIYLVYVILDYFGLIYQWSSGRMGSPN